MRKAFRSQSPTRDLATPARLDRVIRNAGHAGRQRYGPSCRREARRFVVDSIGQQQRDGQNSWLSVGLVLAVALAILIVEPVNASRQQDLPLAEATAGVPLVSSRAFDQVAFTRNVGQLPATAHATARSRSTTVGIYPNQLTFSRPKREFQGHASTPANLSRTGEARLDVPARSTVTFPGARPDSRAVFHDLLGEKSNYFLGSDPSKWITGVESYGRVDLTELYPGIDLTMQGRNGNFAYDWVVGPGASASQIQMSFADAASITIDEAGSLVAKTTSGTWAHTKPVVYQESPSGRDYVDGTFRVTGQNTVGFNLGAYDSSRTLIIDPMVIDYSTFEGGNGTESYFGLQSGPDGSIYSAGVTSSSNYPTASPIQGAYGGGTTDAYVTKYSADGQSRIFSTYIGGSAGEFAADIEIAGDGSAVVVGYTGSADFPTANALYATKSGGEDAFVLKISPDGSVLTFSTYLGGSANDAADGVGLDSSGNVYVDGRTASVNFPAISAFQPSYGGGSYDGFVAGLSAGGASVIYSSPIGGSGADYASGLAVDSAGAVYIGGITSSTNFPTVDPIQGSFGGGSWDAIAAKIAPGGTAISYSTYIGGSSDDIGQEILISGSGEAITSGRTNSSNFPTASAYQPSLGGGDDGFITKIDSGGSGFAFSTYLGGSSSDFAHDLALSSEGDLYVSGYTSSSDFPVIGATQSTLSGAQDAFVSRLNSAGTTLEFSTYLGGSESEWAEALVVDSLNRVWIGGDTQSADFPIANPLDGSISGSDDGFLTRIADYGTLSGTFTNGGSSRVSAYRASDGTQVATTFMDGLGGWSLSIPKASCSSGGYKIFAEAPAGYLPRWYNLRDNYTMADCVSSPQSGVDMVLPPAETVEGTVTDTDTGFLLDGALIYVFRASDGAFVGWTVSGGAGIGKYRISVDGSFTYKIKIHPGAGRQDRWFGGHDWNSASGVSPGGTADFGVGSGSSLDGYVKSAATAADINGAVLYAWNASSGAFVGYAKSGTAGPGRFSLKADPGNSYRILAHAPEAYEDIWSDGAAGYAESTPVAAPGSANFSLREAALIQGTASHLGSGQNDILVSAYTSCGCKSPQSSLSDSGGAYSVKVVSTAASGWQYRLRFTRPNGAFSWYQDAGGFSSGTSVTAPSTGINQDVPG